MQVMPKCDIPNLVLVNAPSLVGFQPGLIDQAHRFFAEETLSAGQA